MVGYVLLALIVSILFTAFLVGVVGWRRPGSSEAGAAGIFLFFIFFFGVWAAAAWTRPFGPVLWEIAWLPALFAAIVFALLVVAAAPPPARRPVGAAPPPALGLSAFFWVLLLVLFFAAAAGTWVWV